MEILRTSPRCNVTQDRRRISFASWLRPPGSLFDPTRSDLTAFGRCNVTPDRRRISFASWLRLPGSLFDPTRSDLTAPDGVTLHWTAAGFRSSRALPARIDFRSGSIGFERPSEGVTLHRTATGFPSYPALSARIDSRSSSIGFDGPSHGVTLHRTTDGISIWTLNFWTGWGDFGRFSFGSVEIQTTRALDRVTLHRRPKIKFRAALFCRLRF